MLPKPMLQSQIQDIFAHRSVCTAVDLRVLNAAAAPGIRCNAAC